MIICKGIIIGQFAVTAGTDEESLRHETAHLQQYKEWGANKYLSNLGTSPMRNDPVEENEADRRAGTLVYDVNSLKRSRSILFSVFNVNQTSSSLNTITIVIYLDYLP